MNVTPSDRMFKVMATFVDSVVGEAPLAVETTPAAENRRQARRIAFDFLHGLVRLSMREGVARYLREMGQATAEDEIRPSPLKRETLNSPVIASANDQ